MKCKSCGFENEYTEKYCFICGRALHSHFVTSDFSKNGFATNNVGNVESNHNHREEQSKDDLSSLIRQLQETNHDVKDQGSPIGGGTQPLAFDSQLSSPDSTISRPPKLEPNHSFNFSQTVSDSREIRFETEQPAPNVTSPPDPGITVNNVPAENGTDKPTEDSLGLRFSLDRLIHGNIRPADSSPAEKNKDSAPVLSENAGNPQAGPLSGQSKPVDIHALELSSIPTLSTLEFAQDHKNLTYKNSGWTDDTRNNATNLLEADKQETALPQSFQHEENRFSTAIDDQAPHQEEKADDELTDKISQNEPDNGENRSDTTYSTAPITHIEQPKAIESTAKPAFHLNGFVISNDTTFVRPLPKSMIIPPKMASDDSDDEALDHDAEQDEPVRNTEATDPTEVQDKRHSGLIFPSTELETPTVAEEPDNAVNIGEYQETSDNNIARADEIEPSSLAETNETEDTGEGKAEMPTPETPDVQSFDLRLELAATKEAAEDLSMIDYSQEVSDDPREYAETFATETENRVGPLPDGTAEAHESIVAEDQLEATKIDSDESEIAQHETAALALENPLPSSVEADSLPIDESGPIAPPVDDDFAYQADHLDKTDTVSEGEPENAAKVPIIQNECPQDQEEVTISEVNGEIKEQEEQTVHTENDMDLGLSVTTGEYPSSQTVTSNEPPALQNTTEILAEPNGFNSPNTPFILNDSITPEPVETVIPQTEIAATTESGLLPTVDPEIISFHEGEAPIPEYRESDELENLSVSEFNWLWKRCGATLVDIALLGLPLGFILSAWKWDSVAYVFIFMIVYWLYSTLFEASSIQATPGKLLFGMIVADQNGNRLSYLKANTRFFAKIMSGVLLRAITEKKQCLHDVLSKTLVLGG